MNDLGSTVANHSIQWKRCPLVEFLLVEVSPFSGSDTFQWRLFFLVKPFISVEAILLSENHSF